MEILEFFLIGVVLLLGLIAAMLLAVAIVNRPSRRARAARRRQ
jgi:ABC-type transporter Mla subunit MlaD